MSLSFIESKKQRASARKLTYYDQLSDNARRFSNRATSVCSNKSDRDNQRQIQVLSAYVSNKKKIYDGRKKKALLRGYAKESKLEDIQKKDHDRNLALMDAQKELNKRNNRIL